MRIICAPYRNDYEQSAQSTVPMIVDDGIDDVVHEAGTI